MPTPSWSYKRSSHLWLCRSESLRSYFNFSAWTRYWSITSFDNKVKVNGSPSAALLSMSAVTPLTLEDSNGSTVSFTAVAAASPSYGVMDGVGSLPPSTMNPCSPWRCLSSLHSTIPARMTYTLPSTAFKHSTFFQMQCWSSAS